MFNEHVSKVNGFIQQKSQDTNHTYSDDHFYVVSSPRNEITLKHSSPTRLVFDVGATVVEKVRDMQLQL